MLTNYGPIFEVWFDGANGGDGYYGGARDTRQIDNRTYYDWDNTWKIVRELAARRLHVQRRRAGLPLGRQRSGHRRRHLLGHAQPRRTLARRWPIRGMLNRGERPGTDWLPAEVDVSIRPGWFYHAGEDGKVKIGRRNC